MKKILFITLLMFFMLGLAACAGIRNSAPEISVDSINRTVRVGQAFDPLAGVSVDDPNDDDVPNLVVTHNLAESWIRNGIFVGSIGNHTYTITVTDPQGAEASVLINLAVTANDITIVATDVIYYINHPEPNYLDGVTATDLSNGNITNTITVDDSEVDLTTVGSYPLTYTATDAADNVETYSVNVFVRDDNQAPTFSGLRNFRYIIGDPAINYLTAIVATDDVDGDITSEIDIDDSNVDYGIPGLYSVSISVSDLAGNPQTATFNVRVLTEASADDDEAPLISGLNDIVYYIGQTAPSFTQGVTAVDDVDDDITNKIVIDSSEVNLQSPGVYNVVYTVSDLAGNQAVENRKVTVILDETAPTLNGTRNYVVLLGNPAPNYAAGVTANDNVDGLVTSRIIIDSSAVQINQVGVYDVTYTVSDNAGNELVRTVTVTVSSNPTLSYVEDRQSYYIGSSPYQPIRGVVANDLLDGDITSNIVVQGTYSSSRPGRYSLTVSITNSAGFTTSQSVTLTVKANANIPTTLGSNLIEIELWTPHGSTIEAAFNRYARAFEAEYPQIKVTILKQGNNYDELRTTMVRSIQGGELPNLVQGYPDHVMEYIDNNAVISVNPYMNHPIWGFDDSASGSFIDITPNYRRENNQYTSDGEYFSLPFNKSTEFVIYNKTVFDMLIADGVIDEFPETWQDLFAVADELNALAPAYIQQVADLFNQSSNSSLHMTQDKVQLAIDKFVPFSYDSDENAFITLTRQWGGSYTGINAERQGVILFDNPQTKEMLNFFYDYRDIFTLPANWNSDYASDIFKLGQTFVTVGSTAGARYNTPEFIPGPNVYPFEFDTAPIFYNADQPENKAAIQQGTNISLVNKGTAEEKLASWLFLKYLTSYEVQLDFGILTGYSPVRNSVLNSEEYVQFISGFDANGTPFVGQSLMISKAARAARLQTEYSFFDQAYVGSSDARSAVGVAYAQIMLDITGNRSVIDTALANAVTEASKTLGN